MRRMTLKITLSTDGVVDVCVDVDIPRDSITAAHGKSEHVNCDYDEQCSDYNNSKDDEYDENDEGFLYDNLD